jgi:vacuolar protein sorting-associated protein IST1
MPHRTELRELQILREMLISHYGRDIGTKATDNVDDCVPQRVLSKISVATPSPELVDLYLYEISKVRVRLFNKDHRPLTSARTGVWDKLEAREHAQSRGGLTRRQRPQGASATLAADDGPHRGHAQPLEAIAKTEGLPLSHPPAADLPVMPDPPAVAPEDASRTVTITTSLPSPAATPTRPPGYTETVAAAPASSTTSAKKTTEEDEFAVRGRAKRAAVQMFKARSHRP